MKKYKILLVISYLFEFFSVFEDDYIYILKLMVFSKLVIVFSSNTCSKLKIASVLHRSNTCRNIYMTRLLLNWLNSNYIFIMDCFGVEFGSGVYI